MRRNVAAFTILEVIIALGTLATCMTIYLRWQSSSVTGIWHGWNNLEHATRLSATLQNFLVKPSTQTQSEKNSETKTTYEVTTHDISGASSLKEFSQDLKLVRANVSWQEGDAGSEPTNITLLTLVPSALLKKGEAA